MFNCVEFSISHNKLKVRPSVINVNSNEIGVLVQFKKLMMVNTAPFCGDHGAGSPYILIKRSMINSRIEIIPARSRYVERLVASKFFVNHVPIPYPVNIIPSQGISAYPTRKKRSEEICTSPA